MPDLDRALRDLLTDEHLYVPARPDAVRILHAGVRRRRRRRAIAMTTVVAATVGAVAVAATVVPAAFDAGGNNPTTPVNPSLHYDVAWTGAAAPTAWSPAPIQPPPPTLNAPRCLASQLKVVSAVGEGDGGAFFTTIQLRNNSSNPCQLVGTPARVAAQAPGQPDVVATRGLHLNTSGVGGDLKPGHLGYLTVETPVDCPSTTGYPSLSITLPSGTSLSVRTGLNAGCGLRTGGLGVQQPPPITPADPRGGLLATIALPRTMHAGSAEYVVTLSNPTGAAISLRHCPGYIEDLTNGSLGVVEDKYALNCSVVRAIAPHASVRYQMRISIPVDISPGTYTLSWRLLVENPVSTTTRVRVTGD